MVVQLRNARTVTRAMIKWEEEIGSKQELGVYSCYAA